MKEFTSLAAKGESLLIENIKINDNVDEETQEIKNTNENNVS